MGQRLSKHARQEVLESFRSEYSTAVAPRKQEILDIIVTSTGYDRKHVIKRLSKALPPVNTRRRKRLYDDGIADALLSVWRLSGYLCSKRLVPYMPELLPVLEKFGHVRLSDDQREKLLSISVATVDRLLKPERRRLGRSPSTTVPSNMLRQNIPIRTFADWHDDGEPGKFEADLVAHCGGDITGQYVNTLTLTEVFVGWTECFAIHGKRAGAVIEALSAIKQRLPFEMRCLDTDNGGEFLNVELVAYCDEQNITFTRGRPYKKNDQAHVEQKNGAIVRRIVGYERLEGNRICQSICVKG